MAPESYREKRRLHQTPEPSGGTAREKTTMPSTIRPMLCTLTKEPMNDEQYLYEIKWDGYRIISYVSGSRVRLDSRNGLDYTKKYPRVAAALKKLGHKVVLDGEVVVFNDHGKPDFDTLQNYNGNDTPIVYCVFDILWLDGYNLMNLALVDRKNILKDLLGKNETLRFSESFDNGPALYAEAVSLNLEGIVAKRKDSEYVQGERANNWLKTPTRIRQEFVIGGWAESGRGRSFRSLLFGAYKPDGNLEWIGRSGGGYREKDMPAILQKLKKLEQPHSPFNNKILDSKGATIHYTKPQLVAIFEFATWTKSGRIRKPATFIEFRNDKKPGQVIREVPKSINAVVAESKPLSAGIKSGTAAVAREKKRKTSASSNWLVLESNEIKSKEIFNVDDCSVELTDVERNVWKNIPKARVIEYYHMVSPYILPHLRDRPLSLHIKPSGATAPGLYIKDMEGRAPACAEIYIDKRRHQKAGKNNHIDYLVCNNEATLLYMANLGCIDINPWMSRTTTPDQPDFINIDLDPTDDDFQKVIETALATKEAFKTLKLISFIKTSGQTGLHIFLPVSGITFPQARSFSEALGQRINSLVPSISTTEISKSLRGNKVLIDPSQNDYADTLASPYSLRPYRIPTVSTPLDWKELKPALNPQDFTIDSIHKRLAAKGDLFQGIHNIKTALTNFRILSKAFD
jgi:bifunctional non-homologous end joining protein LigD